MLRMAVGQTDELEGTFAARDLVDQCAAALDGLEPQAGLLLASHDLDFDELLESIAEAYPSMDLVGCSTLAPMSSAGELAEGSTTLTLFASDVLDFTVGLGTGMATDSGAATRNAVEEARRATEKPPALLVAMPSVEHVDPSQITKEIGSVLGPSVPVIGGGAAPDLPVAMPWLGGVQFFGSRVLTDTLPVLLISGPLKVSIGIAHGWTPVGKTAIVTRSDGHVVYEVDNEPILNFYQRYLGVGSEPAVANPLAIVDENSGLHVLRAPLEYNESDGSATFFGAIPEGSTVQLAMATTDEILAGTQTSVAAAIERYPAGAQPEAALIASCAVRGFLLGSRTREEIERIREGIDDAVPISGFYAFGEIAPLEDRGATSFHNETCVTVLFGT